MNEKDRTLYTNANTYRLHQDNVRWTLAGGYAAFLGASVTILSGRAITDNIFFYLLAAAFFLIGTAYLFILGVENWYYNYFADYVIDCETRIDNSLGLRTLSSFGDERATEITPDHPSFILSLSIVALGNSYYIVAILSKAISDTTWYWKLIEIGVYLIITWIYFCLFRKLFRKWNQLVYPWIKKYQHLWRPQK
jgi:hypothetical protein